LKGYELEKLTPLLEIDSFAIGEGNRFRKRVMRLISNAHPGVVSP
jgi:hypothetical protein